MAEVVEIFPSILHVLLVILAAFAAQMVAGSGWVGTSMQVYLAARLLVVKVTGHDSSEWTGFPEF